MDIKNFLLKYFVQLSSKNICDDNNFNNYENFKNFVVSHYQINHVELFNYIKYVKIKRQIIRLKESEKYETLLHEINKVISYMYENQTFPHIDIKKYLFKIHAIFKMIDEKKNAITNTIESIRDLFLLKNDNEFKYKIMTNLNMFIYRYKVFIKKSNKLICLLNEFINFELSYGIDHNLIYLNNMEKSVLGKKSEYFANKILNEYVTELNLNLNKSLENDKSKIRYYYEINIDMLKLFNIQLSELSNMKGEVDGMIISYDGKEYIIEKIIEVKSSIKSTFDDIKKFVYLQDFIKKHSFSKEIVYGNFIFTKKSFINIIKKDISEWTTYLCINKIYNDIIEKSHLYFTNVLKIVDDNFIKDYYINNNENSIIEKFNIIIKNRGLINNLFQEWKNKIKLDTEFCNVFILQPS
jgi:hypothetical protein